MPITSSNLGQKFAGLDDVYATAEANTGDGAGSWMPTAGTHDCYVLDVDVRDSDFKLKNGEKIPGIMIQFKYQLVQPEPGAEEGRVWGGAPFRLPAGTVPEESATRVRMETERLRGHLQTLLGKPVDRPALGLKEFADSVAVIGKAQPVCAIKVQEDTAKDGKVYRKEFISRLISN